ncbi:hypothetical protein DPMN_107785 [Dreissena polymorpha]|uniref:Uncharacterized protein n=1 Tax=Dreissena polymorpha TaxID=45954 RepID=A0A9D4K7M4_DREPO|nr:hypothetical protein DPMN_107785 [Dreissena polymorpha]
MRDDDTEMFQKINSSIESNIYSCTLSINLLFDGLNVDLPLVCPSEQSYPYSRAWVRVQTKPAFAFSRSPEEAR